MTILNLLNTLLFVSTTIMMEHRMTDAKTTPFSTVPEVSDGNSSTRMGHMNSTYSPSENQEVEVGEISKGGKVSSKTATRPGIKTELLLFQNDNTDWFNQFMRITAAREKKLTPRHQPSSFVPSFMSHMWMPNNDEVSIGKKNLTLTTNTNIKDSSFTNATSLFLITKSDVTTLPTSSPTGKHETPWQVTTNQKTTTPTSESHLKLSPNTTSPKNMQPFQNVLIVSDEDELSNDIMDIDAPRSHKIKARIRNAVDSHATSTPNASINNHKTNFLKSLLMSFMFTKPRTVVHHANETKTESNETTIHSLNSSDTNFGTVIAFTKIAEKREANEVSIEGLRDETTTRTSLDESTTKELLGETVVGELHDGTTTKETLGAAIMKRSHGENSSKDHEGDETTTNGSNGKSTTEVTHNETISNEFHSKIVTRALQNETVPKDLHNETVPKVLHNETASKVLQNETMSKVFQNETTSKELHNKTTINGLQNETAPKELQNETAPNELHNRTTINGLQNEIASKELHSNIKTRALQKETSSKDLQNETTTNEFHEENVRRQEEVTTEKPIEETTTEGPHSSHKPGPEFPTFSPSPPTIPTPYAYCGDGIHETGEECDCGTPLTCDFINPCCVPKGGLDGLLECTYNTKKCPNINLCGNGYTDKGEDCDCGDVRSCQETTEPCCNPTTCKFEDAYDRVVCTATENDCLQSYCNGTSSFCPPELERKKDGAACAGTSQTCSNGTCKSTVCLDHGILDCKCSEGVFCSICCMKSDERICKTTFDFGYFTSDNKAPFLAAGTPCGYGPMQVCVSLGVCTDEVRQEKLCMIPPSSGSGPSSTFALNKCTLMLFMVIAVGSFI